jgi:hypothetical protein
MSNNININNIGIAISTYTQECTDSSRFLIIERSLDSLQNYIKKNLNNNHSDLIKYIYVVVVVDGKIPPKHQDILKKYEKTFDIYYRPVNGGVARTKNTSIRLLLEKQVDIGFLMDDDVEYKDNWLDKYVSTIKNGNIHHMSYCQMPELVHPKNEWKKMGYYQDSINDISIMRHGGGGVGCLLTFTPELIDKIGYFKVMNGKYGYEHINFTHRAIYHGLIPFVSDIIDSYKYIDHIGFQPIGYNKFKKSHSIDDDYRKKENSKNYQDWQKNLHIIEKCFE